MVALSTGDTGRAEAGLRPPSLVPASQVESFAVCGAEGALGFT